MKLIVFGPFNFIPRRTIHKQQNNRVRRLPLLLRRLNNLGLLSLPKFPIAFNTIEWGNVSPTLKASVDSADAPLLFL